MALEGVEVADRRRPEDRRPEHELAGWQDCVVIVGARLESFDEVAQGIDAQAAGEMVVEGRQRLPVERRIMGQGRPGRDRPPSRDLEVQPANRRSIRAFERRREPPWCPGGRVPLRTWAIFTARV